MCLPGEDYWWKPRPPGKLQAWAPPVTSQVDSHIGRAFDDDRRHRLLIAIRYACLASILVLAGFALFDSFWHVGAVRPLLGAHTLTLGAIMLALALSFTTVGVRFIDALAGVACFFFSAGAVLVAEFVGGGLSIYRDPLYVFFIGFTLLIPWSPQAAAACFAICIALYNLLYLYAGNTGYVGTWLLANALLLAGAGIAVFGVRIMHRLQRLEFGYRHRLKNIDEKLWAIDTEYRIFPNLTSELKAPLALFVTPLDTILQDAARLSDIQREQLTLCRRNAVRLLRMVDDAVAVAFLQADQVEPVYTGIDLVRFVKARLAELQPFMERQRIRFSMPELPSSLDMQGDVRVLNQAVLAMFAYTFDGIQPNGQLRVAVSREKQGAQVVVSDDGVGLRVEELRGLFDPPLALDAEVPHWHGRISLAAAKRHIERLGGSLDAVSVLGEGTSLRLWVPRTPST